MECDFAPEGPTNFAAPSGVGFRSRSDSIGFRLWLTTSGTPGRGMHLECSVLRNLKTCASGL